MEFEKIRAVVADVCNIDENKITLKSDLVHDLGADSLDLYQIVMQLESYFEIEVPDERLSMVRTMEDILNLVKESV